jgi:hypothetical protein
MGALSHGELTTGAVKLVGIGVTGVVAAFIAARADESAADPGRRRALAAADIVINAGLIAGGANVLNLFDLRPGRAIKVAGVAGALLVAGGADGPATAAPLAAAGALLAEDLAERSMLGDAGANGLGAMLGTAAAMSLGRRTRIAALAAIAALTAASEVVSFTRVIERTAPLRWADMLGRRPVGTAGAGGSVGSGGIAGGDGTAGAGGTAGGGGTSGDGTADVTSARLSGESVRPAESR